jgi:cytochrome c553
MKRGQVIALVVVAVLAAFVVYLAARGRQAPVLPPDEDHTQFSGVEDCMVCHDMEGDEMRAIDHPLRRDCLDCHGQP